MMINQSPRFLNPDDLRPVAKAYEDSLRALSEDSARSDPFRLRREVARRILDSAFSGVREAEQLKAEALESLARTPASVRPPRMSLARQVQQWNEQVAGTSGPASTVRRLIQWACRCGWSGAARGLKFVDGRVTCPTCTSADQLTSAAS